MSREKSNKKRRCNNNNEKGKKHFCMLYWHDPTHSTKQCCTLKKEAENHKKTCENSNCKNTKCAYNPTKEEIHALAALSKEAMAKENDNKELANFKNMSMSSNKKDE